MALILAKTCVQGRQCAWSHEVQRLMTGWVSSSSALHFNFWNRTSHSICNFPYWPDWPASGIHISKPPPWVLRNRHIPLCAHFLSARISRGARDLNSGPHVCMASPLPTEPLLCPLIVTFLQLYVCACVLCVWVCTCAYMQLEASGQPCVPSPGTLSTFPETVSH